MRSPAEMQRTMTLASVQFDQGRRSRFCNPQHQSFVLRNNEAEARCPSRSAVAHGVFCGQSTWADEAVIQLEDLQFVRLDSLEKDVLNPGRRQRLMFGCYDDQGEMRVSNHHEHRGLLTQAGMMTTCTAHDHMHCTCRVSLPYMARISLSYGWELQVMPASSTTWLWKGLRWCASSPHQAAHAQWSGRRLCSSVV
jgi:hypothetical protein